MPNYTQITEVDDVLAMLSSTLMNVESYYEHLQSNTLNVYYDGIVDDFVVAIMSVPINRSVLDMDTSDDPESVGNAVETATKMIAGAFNLDVKDVELDLSAKLSKLPVADLREARVRRQTGRLN